MEEREGRERNEKMIKRKKKQTEKKEMQRSGKR